MGLGQKAATGENNNDNNSKELLSAAVDSISEIKKLDRSPSGTKDRFVYCQV